MARAYDVVVFGATGFTGRLVCEQLLNHYPQGGSVRWAMAGRSMDKLKQTQRQLAETGCSGTENIPLIVADSSDILSLDAMTKQAKTVITTVGPYTKYGTPLVESCISNSTHYCDLTGEVPWVRKMAEQHHEEAAAKGVKIVNCCGFDSVPFDLGVHMLVKDQEKLGRKMQSVQTLMGESLGGVSGGTIASGFVMFSDPEGMKVMQDPYALVLDDTKKGADQNESSSWGYSELAKKHTFPFIMAPCNTRVVRRSSSLVPGGYGESFGYKEEAEAGGLFSAILATAAMGMAKLFLGLGFLRPLLQKILPKPGEGPSRDLMMKGHWTVNIYGKVEGSDDVVQGRVAGSHDPGYYDTSRMLLEVGLALALQEDELRKAGYCAGGVLTPASAVGTVGIDRLRAAGFVFDIVQGFAASK